MYHYAGNNPIKYVDPDGRWTFSIGVYAGAGAGSGGACGTGVSLGYSEEFGISLGNYVTTSLGAEFGASASAGLTIGFDYNAKVVADGKSHSMTIGGSVGEGLTFGTDIVCDIDNKDWTINLSNSLSDGVSSAKSLNVAIGGKAFGGEGHARYNSTESKSITLKEIARKIYELKSNFISSLININLEYLQ